MFEEIGANVKTQTTLDMEKDFFVDPAEEAVEILKSQPATKLSV